MDKYTIQSAQVSLPGKDDLSFPITQVQSYKQAADVLVLNPYGMHSNPPKDAYAITFSINDQQENRAAICYKPDIRKKELKPGEVYFGNDVTGSKVFFDEDGNIIITCENDENVTINGAKTVDITGDVAITVGGKADINVSGDVTITAPLVKIAGNLEVTGSATLGATVTSNGKDISDTHNHIGSPTAPAGVQSNTGAPV